MSITRIPEASATQSVVTLTDVRKRFDPAAPPALDGLTVSVPQGHVLVLLRRHT